MVMIRLKMRYVKIKKSGFYFEPTPPMREAGLRPESLGKDLTTAAARAALLVEDWDRYRKGDNAPRKSAHGTIAWLLDQYQKAPEYKAYKPKTQKDFDRLAGHIVAKFGKYKAAAVERRHIKGYYRELLDAGSTDNANRIIKTFHILLELARDEGLVQVNHASRMKLPQGNARQVVWSAAEVEKLIAACEAAGRRSIGLAVLMAFDLGQRLGDVLSMTWKQYSDGCILLTQGKTGSTVLIPVLPDLKTALDAITKTSTHIVVSEETKRPYKTFNFTHLFREIADAAGFAGKQFLDLRRSSAVRLAEAGCTTAEVVSITGHSIESGERILEVYVPRSSAMAESAIKKLSDKNESAQKVGKPKS